jgi:hypothetical protein
LELTVLYSWGSFPLDSSLDICYNSPMQNQEGIIQENIELRSRLEFAEKWMRREIQGSISKIQREQSKQRTRKAMGNMFETEWLDILTRRILEQFDDSLNNAPKYTLERLIDAEIYWNTLQRYPQMDALPIVLAYQKIFDAWIEDRLIAWWRNQQSHLTPWNTHPHADKHNTDAIDIDIANIRNKKYTLSIGRLYQIILLIREWNTLHWNLWNLVSFWKDQNSNLVDILISDEFFVPFTELMNREVFTRKRHESKVNYSDAKRIREVMIDETNRKSFLELIFSI